MIKENLSFIKNNKVKKIIIFTVLLIISVGCFYGYFEYKRLNSMYEQQLKITESIVGSLVEKYPKDKVEIVKSIYKIDSSKLELGKNTIKQFGYGKENEMLNDEVFKEYYLNFIKEGLIIFALITVAIISSTLILIKYIEANLEIIYKKLNSIINEGNLHSYVMEKDNDDLKEGIFSQITDSFKKLDNKLRVRFEKLEKEKESIKSLVTDISHQLKTPLASLSLYNTLLLEEELDEEEKNEFLTTNKYSIEKLHNLIDALVNISRLEASMISIKKENNDIRETLKRAIRNATPKAKEKEIDINLYDFESKIIPHDKKWTEESIFNIIENSIKYTSNSGNINIYTEETINYFKINIEDNGIGIEEKEYNNIFKRFYRGQSEEIEQIEGSGVGLYLSRKILEEQGGNVIVSSKVGKGSKFTLFLTTV